MARGKVAAMFQDGSDLPLFTGVPVPVREKPARAPQVELLPISEWGWACTLEQLEREAEEDSNGEA